MNTSLRSNLVENSLATISLEKLLVLLGVEAQNITNKDEIEFGHRRIIAGKTLYRNGENFENLYLVFSGFLKLSSIDCDGNERIIDFPMKSDLLGMDGICDEHYQLQASALTDCNVIVIPFRKLLRALRETPSFEDYLYRAISRSLVREQASKTLLSLLSSEARLARFLMLLSERHEALGFSSTCYVLRMTRQEIGSYLGMSIETVSRCLTALAQAKLIKVEQRNITILNKRSLRTLQRLPLQNNTAEKNKKGKLNKLAIV
jgi:CRP/FNR family transcriptional regulator